MRQGAQRAALPLGMLLFVVVAAGVVGAGISGSVRAQAGSDFEGLPPAIQTGTTATFDFRYVPAVDGLFSQRLTLELEGAAVVSGRAPSEVLVGGVAPIAVEVVSTAANLYAISLTVPPDFLARLGEAGLLTNGEYVLALVVATETGAAMFDFRTPAGAPALIRITAGPAPAPPAAPPPTTTPPAAPPAAPPAGGGGGDAGGEPGLPATGSGGLADARGSDVGLLAGMALAVTLLALGGTALTRRRR